MEEPESLPEEILEEQTQTEFLEKLKTHKFKVIGGVLGFLIFIGAIFSAYKLGQKQLQVQPSPSPEMVVTPAPDPTANWKTYTNDFAKFSLKYPPSMIVTEKVLSAQEKQIIITGSEGIITINTAVPTSSGWGGGCDPEQKGEVEFLGTSTQACLTEEWLSQLYGQHPVGHSQVQISATFASPFLQNKEIILRVLSTFKFLKEEEWKSYTNESQGVSFNYPSNWTARTDSQHFENGDLFSIYIVGPTQKEDTEFYDGAFFTFAIPLSTSSPLEEWLDSEGWTKAPEVTGELPEITKGLKLGNEEAVQVYICGLGCFTYRFAKHEGKIYGTVYFAGGDQKSEYEEDISRIFSTLKFL